MTDAPKPITATVTITLRLDFEREQDGRWIADAPDLPGAVVYGASYEEAQQSATVLALRVLLDRLGSDEDVPNDVLLIANHAGDASDGGTP